MPSAEAPAGWRRWARRPLAHAVALGAVLVVVLAVAERDTGFTADEGSYAIQSEAIERGGWDIHWPFRRFEGSTAHFPYHAGEITPDAEYAYVDHPAWPALLSVTRRVGPEEVGLRLVPLAAVVVTALAGWGIARRLFGVATAPWAFWAVAASPVLANGLMLWAHAPAAAAAGLAMLAALAVGDGRSPRWWWWATVPIAVGALVLLRSEGLLLAGAGTGVLVVAGLSRRSPRLAGLGLACGASAAVALGGERAWTSAITGDGVRDLASRADGEGWLAGRIEGAWTALLEGGTSAGPALCALLALAAVLGAAVVRRDRPALAGPLLGLAAALMVVRVVLGADESVSGLLVAWPVVALGALALPIRDRRAGVLAAVLGLFALGVLATQYDDGGGLQWGGRYLAPLLAPAGAVVGAGIVGGLDRRGRRAAGALLAVTAVASLVVTDEIRRGNADGLAAVAATGHPAAIVEGPYLARLDWGGWPERCWVSDGGDLPGALELLEAAGALPAAYLVVPPAAIDAAGGEATPTAPNVGRVTVRGEVGRGRCPGP